MRDGRDTEALLLQKNFRYIGTTLPQALFPMIYLLLGFLLLMLVLGPNIWVKHVLKKYHRHLPGAPGTGAELAAHLIKEYDLTDVAIEETETDNDHYSPAENAVRLSPEVYHGKSLSAIAVAAHEVGHALQFNREEPVSRLRSKYLRPAIMIKQAGTYILITLPFLGFMLHLPHLSVLTIGIGIVTMLSSVLLYAAILPEEWDASFNKALPILEKGGYVPETYLPAIRQILKACAFTYVAAALADILRLWRWARFIR